VSAGAFNLELVTIDRALGFLAVAAGTMTNPRIYGMYRRRQQLIKGCNKKDVP
jgi:hypothetical protein